MSKPIKTFLTPYEQEKYDWTGKAKDWFKGLRSDPYFETPSKYFDWKSAEMILSDLHKHYDNPKNAKFWAFNDEYIVKVGPQGGRYDYSDLLAKLESYWTTPSANPQFRIVKLGIDYLRRYFLELVDKYGYPQYTSPLVLNTSGGLPVMGHKGEFYDESSFSSVYPYRKLRAAVPGERRLKGKNRVIFMDATSNVRLVDGILKGVKEYLKLHTPLMAGWKNPDYELRPRITKCLTAYYKNIETDQESMDQHFTKEVATQVVLPLLEPLMYPPEFNVLAAYVEQAFDQELFMGEEVWAGRHALFSGIPITSDFEVYYHMALYFGSLIERHIDPLTVFWSGVGDDVLLLLKASDADTDALFDVICNESTLNGMSISIPKSRKNTGDCVYLKRYYSNQMPKDEGIIIGAYPPVLAMNSICYPENAPTSPGKAAVSILQILDNTYGCPGWYEFASRVKSKAKLDFNFSDSDVVAVSAKDWWFRVYGESWNPLSSKSFMI